ncbi:MAG TPA: SDR family NAD(P)-dependent oxidoreductase [Solirubrobacterales bacterium]|nr:SDR family NAD(P)-dependent oxidoreductase [Solirubrobacterales bacterium]
MPRPLEEAVVVITGASSGIGRAAALRMARRGASLGLCARSERPLADVARECEVAGAAVLHRAVDVADEEAVEAFAAAAEGRFGRIDVWVNNAATMAYGPFEQIPSAVFRRIVETNLMGMVHGARAALPRFRAQGSGVLINMSSVWGRVTSPQVAPYVVSKHAIRAFSECLNGELANQPEIQVATVVPQAVDTPIFEHAANYSGRQVRPIPPVLDPEDVARGIELCAENPKREVTYGRAGRGLEILFAVAPDLYRRVAHPAFVRGSWGRVGADPAGGNVLGGSGPYRVEGGWRSRRRGVLGRAFFAAAGGALSGLFRRNS